MKLTEFFELGTISRADFARRVGVTVEAVRLWERGDRTPRRQALTSIMETTGGQVTANDFLEGAA